MLPPLTVLLLFQLAGEALVHWLRLPVPGPVLGMALLFAALFAPRGLPKELRQTAGNLLQHLSLLFVPAGVGIIQHARLVSEEWLPIAVALVFSTVVTIAVTALTIRALARLIGGEARKQDRA